MSDTFITIIVVIAIALVMFIFPLMATANQNDDITQTAIQALVSEFVNTAAKEGKITTNNYDEFIQKLHATGNTYSVELEVQVLDDNPGSKKGDVIGENIYYSVFTNDILEDLEDENDQVYELKKGDYVKAKVHNTNVTFGTQMKNFLYSIVGKDTIAIEASASALVTTTGKHNVVTPPPVEPPVEEPPVITPPAEPPAVQETCPGTMERAATYIDSVTHENICECGGAICQGDFEKIGESEYELGGYHYRPATGEMIKHRKEDWECTVCKASGRITIECEVKGCDYGGVKYGFQHSVCSKCGGDGIEEYTTPAYYYCYICGYQNSTQEFHECYCNHGKRYNKQSHVY